MPFRLCEEDEFAKSLLYSEVPKFYTWNKVSKQFQRRKQGKPVSGWPNLYSSDALGRVYTVSPRDQECFFLRLLLVNVRGPKSFDDLKTVNGIVRASFREACFELKLLESDAHWDSTVADAARTAHPREIRTLFAILLTTCFPSNPRDLWEKFKDYMSEDILHRERLSNPDMDISFSLEIYNEALVLIEDICLTSVNKKLKQLGMPDPIRSAQILDRDLGRETEFDVEQLRQFVEMNSLVLVREQRSFYDEVLKTVAGNAPLMETSTRETWAEWSFFHRRSWEGHVICMNMHRMH